MHGQETFASALKVRLEKMNWRHSPTVSVDGDEVRITIDFEWTKEMIAEGEAGQNLIANEEALECLRLDNEALKKDPQHQLHDYFHVVITQAKDNLKLGEATVTQADYRANKAAASPGPHRRTPRKSPPEGHDSGSINKR